MEVRGYLMVDRNTVLQIFGSLMRHPQYLNETDKYNLTPDDFYYKLDKYIFVAIDNLRKNGAERIQPIDVENSLSTNDSARLIFKQQKGIELLQDADFYTKEENFPYYYKKLKKFNLLETFKEKGVDVSEFYVENPITQKALEVNAKFEELEIDDIIERVKRKILNIEHEFIQNDTTETTDVFEGIDEVLQEADERTNVGAPVQGKIFNEVIAGARKGAFVLRSGSSGVSKTRQAVGDACYLAFPIRRNENNGEWELKGNNKKVLFIATEQNQKEIQKMILAYLTGFNETKFRYGGFTNEEKLVIAQAKYILEQYKDNFYIVRMPNPTIQLVKSIVRENVMLHDIEYVFYDYIHISPSLLNEFKGFNLRNDEVLLMFSTALKDLAVELDIFVMSSTQVNANADSSTNIRNEASLAGSRSIINKADVGVIMARPTKEELDLLSKSTDVTIMPNIVTDVYKVRSGEWSQIRIWSDVNLGNLRKQDLYATNARLEVQNVISNFEYTMGWEDDAMEEYMQQLKHLKEIKI